MAAPVALPAEALPPAMTVASLPDSKKQAIYFFGTSGPHGFLSNFSAHAFVINGVKWPTVEHYYQVCLSILSSETCTLKFLEANIISLIYQFLSVLLAC